MWILPFPENLLCRFLLFLIQAQLSVVFYKPLTFRNPVHFLTFDFYKTFFFEEIKNRTAGPQFFGCVGVIQTF